MMAREHGSRILNWCPFKNCDRLALVMAIILAAALVREMPVSSDDGSTAAWDAPPNRMTQQERNTNSGAAPTPRPPDGRGVRRCE